MNSDASPFHAGEQAVQTRLGVREAIEPWARQVVRPSLSQQHRDFYSQLPFVVAAARDAAGRPWVTLLAGPPGFVTSPDVGSLHFSAAVLPGDALEDSLAAGAELGLLGIELQTRRRNRVNGQITGSGKAGLRFEVGQAFGNCPQYITEREWRHVDLSEVTGKAAHHERLNASMQAWIAGADTLFIGSGYRGLDGDNPAYGMDASHRGGPAGFAHVIDDKRIVLPDYAGNNHFNTIGNLVMDPGVGLLFVNFHNGNLLQLTGRATIDWDSDDVARYPGAQRLVIIDIDHVVQLDNVLPLRWSAPQGAVRSLRLVEKIDESEDVRSFIFITRDDGDLPQFDAGQHLPIEVHIDGQDQPLKRTYSLSNGPDQGYYRISVKREPHGLVSRHLHDRVKVGDILDSKNPDGEFVVQCSSLPVALVSAGIGVTPTVSMLHAVTQQKSRRPVYFVHGVRDGAHHPLAGEVRDIAGRHDQVRLHVAYSQPRVQDESAQDYDSAGRIDAGLLASLIPGLAAEFYLCGPPPFLAAITSGLIARGVDETCIHTETF